MARLGHRLAASTVRNIIRRNGLDPAPRRSGPSWSQFLRAEIKSALACDFFTVQTVLGQTFYALFFIEPATRLVHYLGATRHPTEEWVVQRTQGLLADLREMEAGLKFVIHDRDSKFSRRFDELFTAAGMRVIRTPPRAPRANAFAERWVWSVRRECLDRIIVLGHRHLEAVLQEYVNHYNHHRPHMALELGRAPIEVPGLARGSGEVLRTDRLGGLIHEYRRAA